MVLYDPSLIGIALLGIVAFVLRYGSTDEGLLSLVSALLWQSQRSSTSKTDLLARSASTDSRETHGHLSQQQQSSKTSNSSVTSDQEAASRALAHELFENDPVSLRRVLSSKQLLEDLYKYYFSTENIEDLKKACAERGISQAGDRAALVKKLLLSVAPVKRPAAAAVANSVDARLRDVPHTSGPLQVKNAGEACKLFILARLLLEEAQQCSKNGNGARALHLAETACLRILVPLAAHLSAQSDEYAQNPYEVDSWNEQALKEKMTISVGEFICVGLPEAIEQAFSILLVDTRWVRYNRSQLFTMRKTLQESGEKLRDCGFVRNYDIDANESVFVESAKHLAQVLELPDDEELRRLVKQQHSINEEACRAESEDRKKNRNVYNIEVPQAVQGIERHP